MGRTPKTSRATGAKRAKGFASAAATARRAVDAIAGSHGFAETEVLLRWAEIAGAELSAKCRPVKVSYATSRALGATLVVETTGARAPEVEHLAPRIVERVNSHYGYRAIARLKIMQTARPTGLAEDPAAFAGPDRAPTAAERARAAEMARAIETPGLRAALAAMGAHVLAQDRAGGPPDRPRDAVPEGSDHDH